MSTDVSNKALDADQMTSDSINKTFNNTIHEQAEMNQAQEKVNQKLEETDRKSVQFLRKVKHLASSFLKVEGAVQLVSSTIGAAMKEQEALNAVIAKAGNPKLGKAIYDQSRKQAIRYGQDPNAAVSASMAFMSATTNPAELSELNKLAIRLSKLNPKAGLEGAAAAMKDALTGDYSALTGQFEIGEELVTGSGVDKAGQQGDMSAFIEGMNQLLNAKNMTEEALATMMDSPAAKWNQVTLAFHEGLIQSGMTALQAFTPLLDMLIATFESGRFQPFFDGLAAGLTWGIQLISVMAMTAIWLYNVISTSWPNIEYVVWGIAAAVGTLAALIRGVTLAQSVLNMVMRANPIVLITSLIFGLIFAFVRFGQTQENFAAGFKRIWKSIVDRVKEFISFINKIPGINIDVDSSAKEAAESGSAMADSAKDKTALETAADQQKLKEKLESYQDQLPANSLPDSLLEAGKASNKWAQGADAVPTPGPAAAAAVPAGGKMPDMNRVNEVGRINETVDISSEDLKMMRELAEMKNIQNFVTLTPTVNVQTGDINSGSDEKRSSPAFGRCWKRNSPRLPRGYMRHELRSEAVLQQWERNAHHASHAVLHRSVGRKRGENLSGGGARAN
ncbi:hypothetical protein PACILC2_06920 [Paenibacillus cisolokensis]|uniref:Phage tail tape measure protein domain-containing protein n=2 Tax=Paenibacillus cisolokensis TaxID=1658519 RepID=A0ABQ4N1S5_9BACL|nr:hypothetical protein PACILC2_06920 [Paenibacillus cisolokensis]